MQGTIDLIANALPPLVGCNSLPADGLLITAAGFEDRALAFSGIIAGRAGRAIVLRYAPHNPANQLERLRDVLTSKGFLIEEIDVVEFDRYDPERFSKRLRSRISLLKPPSILLDVSAMSKLAMLLCLQSCYEEGVSLSLFYAEAENKCPTKEEYEIARKEGSLSQPSIQVYTGIHGVERVSLLSSVAMQGQPTVAIAFMSFNEQLTQALLNTVYPSRLCLINSKSPRWPWREEATAWIHEQLRSEWPSVDNPLNLDAGNAYPLPTRSVSAIDYQETVKVILTLYWQFAVDYRMLIAPTGSKMQTLGCFFAKALHPDIHVEYPTPEGFLTTYSTGVGSMWLIELGNLQERIKGLRVVEREAFLSIAERR